MITYNQLSLADIFSDCQEIYDSDKPQFLSLLQQHIDLDEIVPASFRKHFYASTGRTRKYPLNAFLWALIIQRIFSIPTDSLLLVFLQTAQLLHRYPEDHRQPVGQHQGGAVLLLLNGDDGPGGDVDQVRQLLLGPLGLGPQLLQSGFHPPPPVRQ